MRKLNFVAAACLACIAVLGGCRPYDTPEFEEIAPNESGFLIQMEGDTTNQMKFDSETLLAKQQIAVKRVQIPHRWQKTGRFWFSGEYKDVVRLIKVNRSPVTRMWTATNGKGAAGNNQAIWIESKDGVSLSLDVVATAMISEQDAPKFLYRYTSKSLEAVMDQEIRGRIQQELSEAAAKLSLEDLKSDKGKVIAEVRAAVIPFFKERGVEITALGLAGGFTYENEKIQASIDQTFQDQQRQISAEAMFQAQLKENQTIESKAKTEALAAESRAKGEAAAIRALADAKAYEIEKARATGEMYYKLRALEIQQATLAKWDGRLPQFQMGSAGQVPQLLMQLPTEAK